MVLIPALASRLILDWSIAKSLTGLAQIHQMQWDFLYRPRQAVSPHSILSACLALFVVLAFVELMYVCFERNTSRIRTWIGTWPKFVRAR